MKGALLLPTEACKYSERKQMAEAIAERTFYSPGLGEVVKNIVIHNVTKVCLLISPWMHRYCRGLIISSPTYMSDVPEVESLLLTFKNSAAYGEGCYLVPPVLYAK